MRRTIRLHSVKNALEHTFLQLSTRRSPGDSRSSGSFCSHALDRINHCHRHLVFLSRDFGSIRCAISVHGCHLDQLNDAPPIEAD
jgi:hypothetical protein